VLLGNTLCEGLQRITVYAVSCALLASIVIEWLSRVWVHVKARKVAAGNIEADPMAVLEDDGSRIYLNGELVGFTGLEQLCLRQVIVVSCSDGTIRDIQVDACRNVFVRRVHVGKLGRKVV
jgi:hypothetical protein